MSDGRSIYGKYRGMVLNNIDPMQHGRLQVQVPDVVGLIPATWAMPCVPVAGMQNGMFALPMIGAGVWVEFEQGDPDYPIWVGCFWGSAAEVPALARATPPAVQAITLQTPLQNGLTISDLPGPDRRDHAEERDRRDADRQRHRHLHPERQGRVDHDDRPDRHRQRRRVDRSCSGGDAAMPGPLLHLGATVLCATAARRCRRAPNPRVLVSGQPVATMAAPYVVAGCAFVPPGGNGPCVTGAVDGRGDARLRRTASRWCCSTARRSARRPARRCCRSSAQTRVIGS